MSPQEGSDHPADRTAGPVEEYAGQNELPFEGVSLRSQNLCANEVRVSFAAMSAWLYGLWAGVLQSIFADWREQWIDQDDMASWICTGHGIRAVRTNWASADGRTAEFPPTSSSVDQRYKAALITGAMCARGELSLVLLGPDE